MRSFRIWSLAFLLSIYFANVTFSAPIINKYVDPSSIRKVFIVIDNLNIGSSAPIEDYVNNLEFWQEMYESALLEAGLNVITRSKINVLLEEQKISLSGITLEEDAYKIGKVIAADAVTFVNVRLSSDNTIWESIRLIKVDTGEIALSNKIVYALGNKNKKGKHPHDLRIMMFKDYFKNTTNAKARSK